jgi:hypothetical protein
MGSFSFDLTGLVTIAGQLFSSLMPIVAIVGGLIIGAGLVGFILKEVRSIF